MNTTTLLADYRRHGIVFPLPALSESEIQQAQQHYLRLCTPDKTVVDGEKRVFGHLLHP